MRLRCSMRSAVLTDSLRPWRQRVWRRSALVFAALIVLASGPLAAMEEGVVAGDGSLLQLQKGTYGTLFPGQTLTGPNEPVLALDRRSSAGEQDRVLVPGSIEYGRPVEAVVAYERTTDSLYLAWLANISSIHFRLVVVSYHDGVFSEPTVVTGDPFSHKTAPQIAITSDSFDSEDATGEVSRHQRLIVHTMWWEDSVNGEEIQYLPLVIVDGEMAAEVPAPIGLAKLIGAGGNPYIDTSYSLRSSPMLFVAGENLLRLAFVDSVGRFISLSLKMLPVELSALASESSAREVERIADLCASGEQDIATKVGLETSARAQRAFHVSVADHIGGGVQSVLASFGSSLCSTGVDLAPVIDNAVLQRGVDALGADLVRQGAKARGHIVLIGALPPRDGRGFQTRHLAAAKVVNVSLAPQTPEGFTRILLSDNGREAIVAWLPTVDQDELFFVEAMGDGTWTAPSSMALGDELSTDDALRMLSARLQHARLVSQN